MIGYKKVAVLQGARPVRYAVATLSVYGRVISKFGYKLRCEKAQVIKIELVRKKKDTIERYELTKKKAKKAVPYMQKHRNVGTEYIVGKEVIADAFDETFTECSNGIHFYADKKSAINHL